MPPGTLWEGTQSIWHPCICSSCPTQQEEEEEEARPGKHRDARPRKEVIGRSLALAHLDPQREKKSQKTEANLKANLVLALSREVWALELGTEEDSTPSYKGTAEFQGI